MVQYLEPGIYTSEIPDLSEVIAMPPIMRDLIEKFRESIIKASERDNIGNVVWYVSQRELSLEQGSLSKGVLNNAFSSLQDDLYKVNKVRTTFSFERDNSTVAYKFMGMFARITPLASNWWDGGEE